MGWFESLFGSKNRTLVEVIPDRIWMTTDAKFAGVATEAEQRSKSDSVAVLLVAHFPDVLARLEELAGQRTWEVPCRAIAAGHLSPELAASLGLDASAIIDIIVGERHPLPSVDDHLQKFAEDLPCRCRFSHHVSLEDAVIRMFAGDSVKSMLQQMGIKESESIESQMVSRRIRKAQQKIEGRSCGSLTAKSAAEWLARNCPDVAQN